jgi:hypothetical protein
VLLIQELLALIERGLEPIFPRDTLGERVWIDGSIGLVSYEWAFQFPTGIDVQYLNSPACEAVF